MLHFASVFFLYVTLHFIEKNTWFLSNVFLQMLGLFACQKILHKADI